MNTTVPQLRPYQVQGIKELLYKVQRNSRHGVLLADAPGLGKTAQAIVTAYKLLRSYHGAHTLLVVCPTSLRLNWKRELGMWLPDMDGLYVEILTYGEVAKGHQKLERYTVAIFDEAHYLKNELAKRTKACLAIEASYRLFLTGTPVVNRPMELFNVLESLGLKMNRTQFGMRYCAGRLVRVPVKGGHGFRKAYDFTGASNMGELNKALRDSVMVRRTKEEVLKELPAKVRQVISMKFNSGESAAFRARFNGLTEASQILRETKRIPFEELARERRNVALAKLPYIEDFIEDLLEEEEKIVVFCHHRDVADQLASKPGRVLLYGGMTEKQKDAAVQEFQHGSARVFVGQIQAAGVGLTLTAARTVVFAELDWVPGNVTQAEDRLHRIGQRDTVRVFHLVADGSIDARIVNALVEKQQVIEAVMA